MTPAEINLVHDTFRQIARITDQAAALVYARLFELDPSLRPMFRGDMTAQGRELMHVLALAVSSLQNIDAFLPAVRTLGVKHTGYGVREEHYATVGTALVWTLEKGLGPGFTPEVRAAWVKTYTLLADTMKAGARGAQTPAAA